MKASDLRIGNFVLIENDLLPNLKNEPVVVTGIQSRTEKEFPLSDYVISVQIDKYNGTSQFNEFIKPIPLTEEWLAKFEFVFDENLWHNQIALYPCDKGFNYNVNFFEYDNLQNIEFVHQLQNLYHALTGEELILQS